MAWFLQLMADDAPQTGAPPIVSLLPWIVIPFLAYFLLFAPARRQEKQRKALLSSVKKNDRVLNSGGIIGVIESVKEQEDEVVLRGGLRVTKSSIVKIYTDPEVARDKSGSV